MNLIIEKVPRIKWYTDLQPFVAALGHRMRDYLWRFDAVEATVDFPTAEEPGGFWRLSGEQFRALVAEHPQFVWAVISALPLDYSAKDVDSRGFPFADGNPAFWTGSPTPQHPDALFEIVCWDSSATLLIGADQDIATAFRSAYPECVDLDRENQIREKSKA
jgi:hypothetical protein